MAYFGRDVLKWLQSLDLSVQVKSAKWDFSNGYIVAEILFWYFSKEISLHSFINGNSLELKLKNWDLLKEFFRRHQFWIREDLIEGTIHCKEDAAIFLINELYEILTCKSPMVCCNGKLNDADYQQSLALHARSTAAKALKNNLSSSELVVEQDIVTNQQKASAVLQHHAENRASERRKQPDRFQRRLSPGERCLRRHPERPTLGDGDGDGDGKTVGAAAAEEAAGKSGSLTPARAIEEASNLCPARQLQAAQNVEICVKQQPKYPTRLAFGSV